MNPQVEVFRDAKPTSSTELVCLTNYLTDHLAGAETAIGILSRLCHQAEDKAISEFACALLIEIDDDKAVLERLLSELPFKKNVIKKVIGWIGGKLSVFKFGKWFSRKLGPFEALETLALGILGKRSLWVTLQALQKFNNQFPDRDFSRLIERAQTQYEAVDELRVRKIRETFLVTSHES